MEFYQILRNLRKKYNYTQEQLGKILGVSAGSIGLYEQNRREPDNDTMKKLAKVFNVSIDYLLGFESEMPLDNISQISTQKLPLLGDIACGSPIEASEEISAYIETNSPIKADFCLRCKGDSMIGARIYDGDIVFIRKQDMVENGEIAAVIIDNEATLKRVQYLPEENILILKAENPKYADLVYTGEKLDHIRILGKAVSFYSEVK
jgi:repressor LexA